MTWSPDSSITGGDQTGFTTPTYTLGSDLAPSSNAKQHAVTALGGTQAGASANTISSPFTVTFVKPVAPRALPAANALTGLRGAIPSNQYKIIVRKGGLCAAGVPAVLIGRLTIDVPAGMDSYSPAEVRAFASFLVGILSEESADFGDTLVTGVVA
jgi:hypothetical protein